MIALCVIAAIIVGSALGCIALALLTDDAALASGCVEEGKMW